MLSKNKLICSPFRFLKDRSACLLSKRKSEKLFAVFRRALLYFSDKSLIGEYLIKAVYKHVLLFDPVGDHPSSKALLKDDKSSIARLF